MLYIRTCFNLKEATVKYIGAMGINWNFSGKLKSKIILNALEFGGAEQEIKTIHKAIHAKVTGNVRENAMN